VLWPCWLVVWLIDMKCIYTIKPVGSGQEALKRWCVVFCVCRLPRSFVEMPPIRFPYFVGVTTFNHIRAERAIFLASVWLDKIIDEELPQDTGTTWEQLYRVPLREILLFLDNFPLATWYKIALQFWFSYFMSTAMAYTTHNVPSLCASVTCWYYFKTA